MQNKPAINVSAADRQQQETAQKPAFLGIQRGVTEWPEILGVDRASELGQKISEWSQRRLFVAGAAQ